MGLTKRTSPGPTDLIDWLNAEGLLDLDWDFPDDGDLYAAGLEAVPVMRAVVAALEDYYGIVFDPADLARTNLATPRSLAAMITAKFS